MYVKHTQCKWCWHICSNFDSIPPLPSPDVPKNYRTTEVHILIILFTNSIRISSVEEGSVLERWLHSDTEGSPKVRWAHIAWRLKHLFPDYKPIEGFWLYYHTFRQTAYLPTAKSPRVHNIDNIPRSQSRLTIGTRRVEYRGPQGLNHYPGC